MAVFMLLQLAFVLVAGGWLLYRAARDDARQLRATRRELATTWLLLDRIESELTVQIAAGYYDPQPLVALFNDQKELTR